LLLWGLVFLETLIRGERPAVFRHVLTGICQDMLSLNMVSIFMFGQPLDPYSGNNRLTISRGKSRNKGQVVAQTQKLIPYLNSA